MIPFTLREYVSASDNKKLLTNALIYHQMNPKEIEKKDFRQFSRLVLEELPSYKDIGGWFLGTDLQVLPDFDVLLFLNKFTLNLDLKDEYSCNKHEDISKKFRSQKRMFRILGQKVMNIVFFAKDKKLLKWIDERNAFQEISFPQFVELLCDQVVVQENSIERLSSRNFLISPLKDIQAFLDGKYWLTDEQQKRVESISHHGIFGIQGEAGTGRTLIAYDFIKHVDGTKKILFVFPGELRDAHLKLENKFSTVKFVTAKSCLTIDLDEYDVILIDEAQRLHSNVRITLAVWAKENYKKKTIVFFFDVEQALGPKDAGQLMLNLCQTFEKDGQGILYNLSKNIRSNPIISAFVRNVRSLSKRPAQDITVSDMKDCVDVRYFSKGADAIPWIKDCIHEGYHFFKPTGDNHGYASSDQFVSITSSTNTHGIIGGELDKVVTYLDDCVGYDKYGELVKKGTEYYFVDKESCVNMSRAKEKLALAIIHNPDVYMGITDIVFRQKIVNASD